jgi:DNA-binding beta-propeller fold protein YncE
MNRIKIIAMLALITPFYVYVCEFAYVTNFQGGGNGRVTPVNVISGASDTAIVTGNFPNGIALSPDQSKIYVTIFSTETVQIFDAVTNALLGSTPTGNDPAYVVITPDGTKGYTANQSSTSVTVFDAITFAHITNVNTPGVFPISVAVTPDGTQVLVSLDDGSIGFIDTTTQALTIPAGTGPGTMSTPWGIAITPDGTIAYVAEAGSNIVQRIDIINQTTLGAPIPVGNGPENIAITPDGLWVYVINASDNTVSRINTTDQSVVTFGGGTFINPTGIAINCDGTIAYIADQNAGIWEVSIPSNAIDPTPILVPSGTFNLALTCPLLSPSSFTGTATCLTPPSVFTLTLQWSASQYAAYYNIYENGVLIGTVQATDPLTFQTTTNSLANPSRFTITAVGAQECETTPLALSSIDVITPCEIAPPTNFKGFVRAIRYINRTDFFLTMQWTASTAAGVIEYHIYRNGILIGIISADDPLIFTLQIASCQDTQGFTLTAIGPNRTESAPVDLIIV